MNVETELNNQVNKTHIWFKDFTTSYLDTVNLRTVRSEEMGETAVFASKDKMKTVMHSLKKQRSTWNV